MKNYVFCCISILYFGSLMAQDPISVKPKIRFPIWTYHSKNVDVIGVSAGLIAGTLDEKIGTSRTFGMRLELDPLSVMHFLFNGDQVSSNLTEYIHVMDAKINQKVYGLNVSSGNKDKIDMYGISITALVQRTRKNYGLSIGGWSVEAEKSNGIMLGLGGNTFISNGLLIGLAGSSSYLANGVQVGGMVNDSKILHGLQIGLVNEIYEHGYGLQIGLTNKASNFRGIQLGLWNVNGKRSWPLINWQFKS